MDVREFINQYKYPNYNEVQQIITNDKSIYNKISLLSESGEFQHQMITNMYNNLYDQKELRNFAEKLSSVGDLHTLRQCFYVIIAVLRSFNAKDNIDTLINIRELIKVSFEGLHEWEN